MDSKHRPGEYASTEDDTEGQKFTARGAVPTEDGPDEIAKRSH